MNLIATFLPASPIKPAGKPARGLKDSIPVLSLTSTASLLVGEAGMAEMVATTWNRRASLTASAAALAVAMAVSASLKAVVALPSAELART